MFPCGNWVTMYGLYWLYWTEKLVKQWGYCNLVCGRIHRPVWVKSPSLFAIRFTHGNHFTPFSRRRAALVYSLTTWGYGKDTSVNKRLWRGYSALSMFRDNHHSSKDFAEWNEFDTWLQPQSFAVRVVIYSAGNCILPGGDEVQEKHVPIPRREGIQWITVDRLRVIFIQVLGSLLRHDWGGRRDTMSWFRLVVNIRLHVHMVEKWTLCTTINHSMDVPLCWVSWFLP